MLHSASTPTPVPTLDVVIVHWNSGRALPRCLASLDAASSSAFTFDRIVIVDNASDTACRPARHARLPEILVLRNDENLGFAEACNQGAAGSRADYLLFINPDTEIDPHALDRAIAAFGEAAHADVAVVGLQLVDEEGQPQATCGRFLTPWRMFNQVTGLSLISPRWFQGFRMTEWDHGASRAVDYVSAACSVMRREVFEALGGFDARFTVYLEDVDFAWRARGAGGWRSLFLADAAVYHESGWATGRHRSLRLAYAWRSLLVYGHRHWGLGGQLAAVATVLALAPLARCGQGLAHGSLAGCREAGGAYLRMIALLRADRVRRAADRRSRAGAPEAPPRAALEPVPEPADSPIDPIVRTSS